MNQQVIKWSGYYKQPLILERYIKWLFSNHLQSEHPHRNIRTPDVHSSELRIIITSRKLDHRCLQKFQYKVILDYSQIVNIRWPLIICRYTYIVLNPKAIPNRLHFVYNMGSNIVAVIKIPDRRKIGIPDHKLLLKSRVFLKPVRQHTYWIRIIAFKLE